MDDYDLRMQQYRNGKRTAAELWQAWLDYCKEDRPSPYDNLLQWLNNYANPEEVADIIRQAATEPTTPRNRR
jgi:hypothetical protein